MDIVQFIHSINPNNITTADLIINYIDQTYLLYSLVPEDSNVMVSNNSLNSISFNVSTSKSNINNLSKVIDTNKVFQPYRKQIMVDYISNSNTINITMKK